MSPYRVVASVIALMLICAGCGSDAGQVAAGGRRLARELRVVEGSTVWVGPAYGSAQEERELPSSEGRSWQAVIDAGPRPLDSLEGYITQLEDAGFELRSAGPAACVERWNGGQQETQASPLGVALPSGASSIGVMCHVVGFRDRTAYRLVMRPAWGQWNLYIRRFTSAPEEYLEKLPMYRPPNGKLPEITVGADELSTAMRLQATDPLPLPEGDRMLPGGLVIDNGDCRDMSIDAVGSSRSPSKVMEQYTALLTGAGMTPTVSGRISGQVWATGMFYGGGPSVEMRAVASGDDTRLLVASCRG